MKNIKLLAKISPMNIAVIGAGASGIYYSLLRKERYPHDQITIFEKEQKAGRKLLATGNGHCNLLNSSITPDQFNNPEFVKYALGRYPYESLEKVFESWGIPLLKKDSLVYPLSYSAKNVVNQLLRLIESHGINLINNETITSYSKRKDGYYLNGKGPFDRVVFSTGGTSQPKLGSDGRIFNVFAEHGYEIETLIPGLCPLVLQEKTKSLSGQRHKAKVGLVVDKKTVYEEEGEILFKDDGISGIVIFNIESIYIRHFKNCPNAQLKIDLFPEFDEEQLCSMIDVASKVNKEYMLGFLSQELINYLLPKNCKQSPSYWAKASKNIIFNIKDVYDFNNSQVTIGGIKLSSLTTNLESKYERGVFFIGECLDIDGTCGGFNLSWALLSALLASE